MRLAAVLTLGLWIAASAAQAQVRVLRGGPPISDEVKAALAKVPTDRAAELYRLAAAGRADAQAYAGVLLAFRSDAPADKSKGCGYLQAAAATRSDAMHFLGESYQYGRCGQIDLEKAIITFDRAGDMGLAKSRCAEGNLLLELGRDQARAVRLCTEGAEAGDPDAQTDLGNFYLQGRIVGRDMSAARGWYEKAAAQNQANAAHVLGQIYWNGDGVARDTAKAVKLWRIAYANGRQDSAFFIGNEAFLRAGRGDGKWDPAGLVEARDWFAKAADGSSPEIAAQARERRDLSEQLIGVMQRKGVR